MSGVIRTVPCGCESGQPCTPATRCAITTAVHIQREDDEAEMERLREDHEAELAALRERAERAEAALLRKGYRMSCDIPACNCGDQWTHGGHAEMRLTEIREALEQADARRNGETLLADVVHIAARAERATTIEAELAALRAELQKVRSAAISGMDAATQHGHSLVQQAARLKAESNPDALESERAANALLTEQLQKAEAGRDALRLRIAALEDEKNAYIDYVGDALGQAHDGETLWDAAQRVLSDRDKIRVDRDELAEKLPEAWIERDALRADSELLHRIVEAQFIDGYGDVDFHEEAAIAAAENGREEPNTRDYIAAWRVAMEAER